MPAKILVYHGIHEQDLPVESFREQMRFIKDSFQVCSLEQAAEHDTNAVVLTFDDGLRNNYTQAYPILWELDLPATFFVCPQLISEKKWLWNHEFRARLSRLEIRHRVDFVKQCELKSLDTELIIWYLKHCAAHRRETIRGVLWNLTKEFVPTRAENDRFDMMTWADIKAMQRSIITIGSHSASHQPLTGISSAALTFEVEASKCWLEAELNRDVDQFCYPEGMYNRTVMDCVARGSYSVAVTLNHKAFEREVDFALAMPRMRLPWTKEKKNC